MTWLMDNKIEANAGLSLARMTVDPGVVSEAHRHVSGTEAIHMLSGCVQQRSGERWVSLKQGETILIPAGAIHQMKNLSDETTIMMIAYSSGSRVYEAECEHLDQLSPVRSFGAEAPFALADSIDGPDHSAASVTSMKPPDWRCQSLA